MQERRPEQPVVHMAMEVKARELEARTLLGFEFASRGYRVYLGSKAHLRWALRKGELPPGLFFEKSLTTGKEEPTQRLIDRGCVIASIDEESGLLDRSYEPFLDVRSNPTMVDKAAAVFCWGQHDYEAWSNRYPNASDRIHLTGSPRVDFWRADFASYYRNDVAWLRERFGAFVLVVTNMGYANGIVALPEQLKIMRKDGTIRTAEDEELKQQEFADDRRMLEEFVDLVKRMSAEFKETQFVLRPHPVERLSTWDRAMANRDNVHVLREGSVSKWVRAARAVVHEGDTTGIEARISGTPPIAFVPFDSPRNREIPNEVSIACRTAEEVSAAVAEALSESGPQDLCDAETLGVLQIRFANIAGPLAAERIVTALSELPIPASANTRISWRFRRRALRSTIRRFVLRRLGKMTRNMNKFPSLRKREVTRVRAGLSEIRPEYADISVRKVFGDVFVLERHENRKAATREPNE